MTSPHVTHLAREIHKFTFKEITALPARPPPEQALTASRKIIEELCVRLSHRIKEYEKLPFDLGFNAYSVSVKKQYSQSCAELNDFLSKIDELRLKPLTKYEKWRYGYEDNYLDDLSQMQFHEPSRNPQLILNAGSLLSQLKFILQQQVQRHKPIVWETAQAVHQLAIDRPELHKEHPMVQKFLKRFHQSRISTRLLYSHCHTLQEPLKLQHQIGIFSTHVDIDQIVQMAIEHAAHICIDEFGEVPPIVVEAQPVLPTFNIPSHIEYALFELLKNAMRATIERSKQTQIPIDELPITIRWYSTQHHTFVEIQDLGGGLPKRKNYFTFSYSTAPPPEKDMVMAGYGYGLPLSKLYCRYLGGELQLERLGEGTMAKISLKRDFQSEEAVL